MFATFKRFALVVLVPAVVGLGVWAQWSTLMTKFAMLGTSSAESMPVRVGVGLIGSIVVFGLILVARSMNRRPQH